MKRAAALGFLVVVTGVWAAVVAVILTESLLGVERGGLALAAGAVGLGLGVTLGVGESRRVAAARRSGGAVREYAWFVIAICIIGTSQTTKVSWLFALTQGCAIGLFVAYGTPALMRTVGRD